MQTEMFDDYGQLLTIEIIDNTNFRQSNPIEYVLQCILHGKDVQKFDARNALDQWFTFKNEKPCAYALDNGDGELYDLRKWDNPHNDRNKVIKLYKKNI